MRPDYCPMANEPCQSMCDTPCSKHRLHIDLEADTAPQPAKQPLTREEILELAEPFGAFQYGDAQGHKRIDFANAIIAAYERINVYAAPQPRRNVTYVCPCCHFSLERQE